jgi:hypothetical protein
MGEETGSRGPLVSFRVTRNTGSPPLAISCYCATVSRVGVGSPDRQGSLLMSTSTGPWSMGNSSVLFSQPTTGLTSYSHGSPRMQSKATISATMADTSSDDPAIARRIGSVLEAAILLPSGKPTTLLIGRAGSGGCLRIVVIALAWPRTRSLVGPRHPVRQP